MPHHSKKSIPYNHTLRLNGIFSNNQLFDKRCNELESWPVGMGYSKQLVREQASSC